MADGDIRVVLEPEDEYPHEPDEASNYNESMYLNAFDLEREVGCWVRIGNRVNEGYAEMTVCVYLPGGRVGFTYARPEIGSNDEMRAGGLHIEVVEPFAHLRIAYDGQVCLLDDPLEMADPRTAFTNNPMVPCRIELDVRGISPMYGGRPVRADGTDLPVESEQSFAKAHYEQHTASTGTIEVDGEVLTIDGFGLRDKSWGPRYWQAVTWYRWLPMAFGPDLAMMISLVGGADPTDPPRQRGMVLRDGTYSMITSAEVTSEWDDDRYQTSMTATVRTDDDRAYTVTGEVLSLIPLRNRRTTPDGETLVTRITEAMTRFECDGRRGIGMSEYLDQIVDGEPLGPDVT